MADVDCPVHGKVHEPPCCFAPRPLSFEPARPVLMKMPMCPGCLHGAHAPGECRSPDCQEPNNRRCTLDSRPASSPAASEPRIRTCPDCNATLQVTTAHGSTFLFYKHDAEFCRRGVLLLYRSAQRIMRRQNEDIGKLLAEIERLQTDLFECHRTIGREGENAGRADAALVVLQKDLNDLKSACFDGFGSGGIFLALELEKRSVYFLRGELEEERKKKATPEQEPAAPAGQQKKEDASE